MTAKPARPRTAPIATAIQALRLNLLAVSPFINVVANDNMPTPANDTGTSFWPLPPVACGA